MANRNRTDSAPALEFEELSLNEPGNVFSMTLHPGEMALFECRGNQRIPDLWSYFVGLSAPPFGGIRFRGKSWNAMNEGEKEANRLTIGYAFTGREKHEAQWIENLDIDENVVLAQSMNPAHSQSEVDRRLASLLDSFDMDRLPGERPSQASSRDSMKAQWIRAFLPEPLFLLILVRPTFEMGGGDVSRLIDQILQACKEGTAVVWIGEPPSASQVSALGPTIHFEELPGGLRPSTRPQRHK